MKIERLTPEQEARLPEIRDEWLAVGLSTEPADRKRAEAGVRLAYEAAGLSAPKIFLWLRSPHEGAIGTAYLRAILATSEAVRTQVGTQVGDQVGTQVGAQVWDQVWDQVGAQVRTQVGAQVRTQVWDQVWAQVGAQVGTQVGAQVGTQVGDQVWAQVGAQVGTQVWDQVRNQVWDQVWAQVGAQVWDQVDAQVWDQVDWYALWGQHDAGYMGWFDYFGRVLGMTAASPVRGLQEVARSSGWWWAYRGAALLTERPVGLERDAEGRLHSGTGPAIAYSDGWGLWAWHGVCVPQAVIENPESLNPKKDILAEPNAEVRRVMIERFGADRFMREVGAKKVSEDDVGILWRVDLKDDPEPLVMVEVENSTPEPDSTFRRYMIRVPPATKTAREAVAWTFDLEVDEYAPAVQT